MGQMPEDHTETERGENGPRLPAFQRGLAIGLYMSARGDIEKYAFNGEQNEEK
jgi:hypothetical protein